MTMRVRLPTVVVLSALTLGGCRTADPEVGAPILPAERPVPGLQLSLSGAQVDGDRVTVRLVAARDGHLLTAADAAALGARWTLALLDREPVSGLEAWRALVLTGATVPSNPVAGPGTPADAVVAGAPQPGGELALAYAADASGALAYVFQARLPAGLPASATLRAGGFLPGGEVSDRTTTTLDFRPDGGAPRGRELVLDAACATCHATLRAHGGTRAGTRVCVTCHTWQHADPDTADPAAPLAATGATAPNPLELGRLVHRIHRGKYLPTLYASSSTDPAPALPSLTPLPLPFSTTRTSATGKNPPVVGRRFSVVGDLHAEHVYGAIVSRTDNGQPARTVASGITFPRDYRDCDACHAGAAQAPAALVGEVSRRSCAGCHPDVWFGADPVPDAVHFAHPGGPQATDAGCGECHVPAAERPSVLAPLGELHVALVKSPRYDKPKLTILSVENLTSGQHPVVKFTVEDRNGALLDLDAPTPAMDQAVPASPVPRALGSLQVMLAGPAAPDFASVPGAPPVSDLGTTVDIMPVTESIPLTLAPDGNGVYAYPMTYTLPDGPAATWLVALQASRSVTPSSTVAAPFYDGATNRFTWPYTGERESETADQVLAWVGVNGATPSPRRTIVETARCSACHLRLAGHGSRTSVASCPACHAPNRTDWRTRNRDAARKVSIVYLATYDGLEERSTHFKTFIHRLHTGTGTGTANLSDVAPFVIYGPRFYDEARFPSDLGRCTNCHAGTSYRVESVPADASPTTANETASVLHAGTQVHTTCEATPPVSAACLGCHGTAYARSHAARYVTADRREACGPCHGAGTAYPVEKVHGFTAAQ
jgi:OmcA/MtrC family decaheme c-type cytochrome